ncbi:MAG: sulfite exporter TauE/SafE family protein [Chloroflexota bacterium]|nr:sulfite exporter TauE/SafE family protein [Chloroflexota bacterium]MDE3101831.1 sulfite exporter TauE/SafE family protein [Chloroflexota bacterium]
MTAVMVAGLFVLSFVSGMLGLGVAFAAVPFLALFLPDLVHQVQPLSLLLNGLTALFAALGFWRGGHLDWSRAIPLAVVTTLFAPLGALAAQRVDPLLIWAVYLGAVIYLAYRLFRPVRERPGEEDFRTALVLAAPISVLSGLLGVGPGFLLMPTLVIAGFPTKRAAGINAFAVTPPSFSALIPHLPTAVWDPSLTVALLAVGAVGAFGGATLSSRVVPALRLKQLFGVLIVVMTAYKIAAAFA